MKTVRPIKYSAASVMAPPWMARATVLVISIQSFISTKNIYGTKNFTYKNYIYIYIYF